MVYDATWFKEYDRVYFEIWRRVTRQMVSTLNCTPVFCKTNSSWFRAFIYTVRVLKCMTFPLNNVQKSFRDALEEVYSLNRFPLRQRRMKGALECDDTLKMFEEDVSCFG
jgi:hypothetical protein